MARVVVVDDDQDIREILVHVLEAEGHQVRTAPDGNTALDILRREPSDVVVLDLMMPLMNGWEFRDAQKRDPRVSEIPVIVISAATVRDPIDADAFLAKPFDLTLLLDLVARHARRPPSEPIGSKSNGCN